MVSNTFDDKYAFLESRSNYNQATILNSSCVDKYEYNHIPHEFLERLRQTQDDDYDDNHLFYVLFCSGAGKINDED